MWSKIKERFKGKDNSNWHIDIDCLNCGTNFSGHYCPNCGQAVKEYDKPFGFIFFNFLGDFFAFDTRFFKTLLALVARPGFLTKEYFAGRRVRYSPPFRIFVFVSFILFFLLQIVTNRGLSTVLDSDLKEAKLGLDSISVVAADSIFNQVNDQMSAEEKLAIDNVLNKGNIKLDSVDVAKSANQINLGDWGGANNIRLALNAQADKMEQELEEETDPEKRAELQENIRMLRSPEATMAKILKYISYAFFLLLPLFAMILKLIYIRRRHNYMRHLVFSIHIHSFIFLVMTAIIGLYLLVEGNINTVAGILFLSIPLYIIVALKKFYGQSIGKVVVKFFALSFIYNFVFFTVILLASLDAINLL
ncbi:DUF3667 domain-containing protein [Draconibacterium sp. IB214405]|uniref:DUF3667 domain-containing protein n=1 Tax=Draconibacterium sp. IB214405 TaxID=3097352 RepID=UPI002A0C28E9|nr:DUF3667 domain-containing protein [Draconibacterium sp. IB214405]MDX8341731.1 DUF3667 domain-containing protein [Draconibacterium sp. IB214405]